MGKVVEVVLVGPGPDAGRVYRLWKWEPPTNNQEEMVFWPLSTPAYAAEVVLGIVYVA